MIDRRTSVVAKVIANVTCGYIVDYRLSHA